MTTMRARNGYRGVHEFVSGTRVVRLRRAGAGASWNDVPVIAAATLPDEAQLFGPFRGKGRLGKVEEMDVFLARDEMLHRDVWILVSPEGPALSPERRRIARPARARWLQGGACWDAVEAIRGAPLPEWLAGASRLEWIRARSVLRDLAHELAEGAADGSIASGVSLDQVWIERAGRVKLLEAPLTPIDASPNSVASFPGAGDRLPAVGLLRLVVDRCCRRESLPVHARAFVEELGKRPSDAETLGWAARELDAMMEQPAKIDWATRMAAMATALGTELFLIYSLACILVPLVLWKIQEASAILWVALSCLICMALPAVIGFVFRGGIAFRLMKIEVRTSDGASANRLQCAWRNFVAYAAALYFYSLLGAMMVKTYAMMLAGEYSPTAMWQFTHPSLAALTLFTICSAEVLALIFFAGAIYAVVRPERGWQDVVAGTRLVPR
jgi:hypothetical protein